MVKADACCYKISYICLTEDMAKNFITKAQVHYKGDQSKENRIHEPTLSSDSLEKYFQDDDFEPVKTSSPLVARNQNRVFAFKRKNNENINLCRVHPKVSRLLQDQITTPATSQKSNH
uniref:Uncharacterized protein isoform X2 n=1 Tax=Pogona vitticeps TaxID=103695 RepID=A0ABM5FYK5_9SAUR